MLYKKLPQIGSFKISVYYCTDSLVSILTLAWLDSLFRVSQGCKSFARTIFFSGAQEPLSNLHVYWQNWVPCCKTEILTFSCCLWAKWHSQLLLPIYHLLPCGPLYNMALCFKANRRTFAAASNLTYAFHLWPAESSLKAHLITPGQHVPAGSRNLESHLKILLVRDNICSYVWH